MFLEEDLFKTVVEHTPLIAIDLIVSRTNGNILLGQRKNRPARGFWFVPGGRVRKNETLDDAFHRISQTELGVGLVRSDYVLQGIFEHFYLDNFSGDGFPTHYVGLAYPVQIDGLTNLPKTQHSDYIWLDREELLADKLVHENTKAYFRNSEPLSKQDSDTKE